jgi:hypothetical protein
MIAYTREAFNGRLSAFRLLAALSPCTFTSHSSSLPYEVLAT